MKCQEQNHILKRISVNLRTRRTDVQLCVNMFIIMHSKGQWKFGRTVEIWGDSSCLTRCVSEFSSVAETLKIGPVFSCVG